VVGATVSWRRRMQDMREVRRHRDGEGLPGELTAL